MIVYQLLATNSSPVPESRLVDLSQSKNY